MDSAKTKIKTVAESYIRLFPGEYEAFKDGVRTKRSSQRDDYGTMRKGSGDYVERVSHEIPERMYAALRGVLEQDEWDWFRSIPGTRWFARTFRQFAVIEKV